jgi:hypothetical protein
MGNEMIDLADTYDCTDRIGPLVRDTTPPEWPMYSYDRPAYIVWNAIAGELHRRGWSERDIQGWLQSKGPRWALDMDLGEALDRLGRDYAKTITRELIR